LRCRFGGCEIDAAKRSLERHGEPVAVEPRVFDLLIFLIERHDRVVLSEELLASLWGGARVTPSSISRAVHKARLAVGDDGERQCVISTVHGRGFRFVAAVHREALAAFGSEAADPAGRAFELGRLEAALRRAERGRGGLVYLTGEPGVGKTRLACEFVAHVLASGAASAHLARCPEGFDAPAYWPWRQLARALRSDPVAADFERLAGRRPSQLALVEPERAGAEALASPPELPCESVRLQLFESAVLGLGCEARERPIVLVLEDVQRADLASLGFLRFLAHLLPVLPILIVASFREADLARDPERTRLLADAERGAGAETRTLAAR
jgi:DNA-binding winged helix-turn-helix (wHTH) protein